MSLNTAIKRAIEQGYKPTARFNQRFVQVEKYPNFLHWSDYTEILLDPQFWQCLGVAIHGDTVIRNGFGEKVGTAVSEEWRRDWHRIIDALASGKTAEEFFQEILK